VAINVRGLSKSYGSVKAVHDLSFEVPQGALFAFLGTNGAGKSTTISCLTTLLKPDAGEITIEGQVVGHNDDAIRSLLGVVFQSSVLDSLLSVRENLMLKGSFYGVSNLSGRIVELAELIGLTEFLDQRYGTLSGGQQRRADIARALLHSPRYLFLDEPTAGLDPQSRENVWSTIAHIRETLGLTVLLTTHYMEETENATEVTIIDRGSIVAQGTPRSLRREHSSSVLSIVTEAPHAVEQYCTDAGLACTSDKEGTFLLRVTDSESAFTALQHLGSIVTDFEFRHGTMDDVFLALTDHRGEQ
jgi:multidrug/hemolysin transport system ATP-binding protein